jgi:hypothetical protein
LLVVLVFGIEAGVEKRSIAEYPPRKCHYGRP